MDFGLDIAIHPYNQGRIVVIVPGVDGSLDGYSDKYKKVAEYIIEKEIGAVVRMPNPFTFGFGWDINLRQVLDYCISHSPNICSVKDPEIMSMGFSAGAGAVGMLSWEYPEIKKILLLEPALAIGEASVLKGLQKYTGEAYIVVGKGSTALGETVGNAVYKSLNMAKNKELFVIDNCDHQFKGEINGRIMSQAPIYAFSKGSKVTFPDPEGGIILY